MVLMMIALASILTVTEGEWRMVNGSEALPKTGAEVSKTGFNDGQWMKAVMPGTVLSTLVASGRLPEPYWDLNNKLSEKRIPDLNDGHRETYTAWFRTEFDVPADWKGRGVWLCPEGINYRGEIWLNGKMVTFTAGMFACQPVDVSLFVRPGVRNALAVKVYPVDVPGDTNQWQTKGMMEYANGGDGLIGRNSTMLMSVGWDFTFRDGVRDRNTGIWRPIRLFTTGDIRLDAPFVKTKLSEDLRTAELDIVVEACNSNCDRWLFRGVAKGEVEVAVEGTDLHFAEHVELQRGERRELHFRGKLQSPRLWWPVNKGKPDLYTLRVSARSEHGDHALVRRFGVREAFSDQSGEGGARQFWINRRKIFIRGTNWIPEAMLRTDDARMEAELKLTRSQGVNMVRLWGGGIVESDRFYDLCDEMGLLVWQEFFMTGDTAHPADEALYLSNVADQVRRIRHHPSVCHYVCSNESTEVGGIRELLERIDGTRSYQMQSECDGVHDGSPYFSLNPMRYYDDSASPRGSRIHGFNPEYGTAAIPTAACLREVLPESRLWPRDEKAWAYRDGNDFYKSVTVHDALIRCFGEPTSLDDYCRRSEAVDYHCARAIWEVWNRARNGRGTGVLWWFNNVPLPKVTCYGWDYSLEPTAQLYATRNALEPLHAQYEYLSNVVSVVSDVYSSHDLVVTADVYDFDTHKVWSKSAAVALSGESCVDAFAVPFDRLALDRPHFLRLGLKENGSEIASSFYWRSSDCYEPEKPTALTGPCTAGFAALSDLPRTTLETTAIDFGGRMKVFVRNAGDRLAFLTRIELLDENGKPLRPSRYSDNWFCLVPNESRTVTIERPKGDCKVFISAWNVVRSQIPVSRKQSSLVVPDAATVSVDEARKILSDIAAGRPTLVIGGPLLSNRKVLYGGETLTISDVRKRIGGISAEHVVMDAEKGFRIGSFSHSTGPETVPGGSVQADPNGVSMCVKSGGKLRQWDIQSIKINPYAAEDDLLVLEMKSDYEDAEVHVDVRDASGATWYAAVPISREWHRAVLTPNDFTGKGMFDPRRIVRLGLGVSSQYSPRMRYRESSFHVRLVGSARSRVGSISLAPIPWAELPPVEGLWPEYKTYGKDGRRCILDRPSGEGFSRGNVWRCKRLANDAETILIERRPGSPERCVALFGYQQEEVRKDADLRARMTNALRVIEDGALLFEAGTTEFAYRPGEVVEVGASWRGCPQSLSLTVADARGRELIRRVYAADDLRTGRTSFTWQPSAAAAKYSVKAVLDGDDVIEHDFAVVKTDPDPVDEFVVVREGRFWLKGQEWNPVAINFWPKYSLGTERPDNWRKWLADGWYSPNLVKKDLLSFVRLGGNCVFVQAGRPGEERNERDFLRICRELGVRVNLSCTLMDPLSMTDEHRALVDEHLKKTGVAGDSTVFAFDTVWEPGNSVFRHPDRRRFDADWQDWAIEQFGSVSNAISVWGVDLGWNSRGRLTSPPDEAFRGEGNGKWTRVMASYRRFMDNYTSRRWNVVRKMLTELAPHQLQSFRQGNTLPHDFALTGPIRHVDFVMPEGYSFKDTDEGECAIGWVTCFIDAYSQGKPIIWSEFGQNAWSEPLRMVHPQILDACVTYSERFLRVGIFAGARGFSPWYFPGGYRSDERSDYGFMGPDGEPRPPLRLYAQYAPTILKPRVRRKPSEWMSFDRDVDGGGYWKAAFASGCTAFARAYASGQLLGVKIAGTEYTSVDCPALGLGDVPINGRMPVKYLDSDFDVFSASHAADGCCVVTAQLGNPGPASWRSAAAGFGGVRLVARDKVDGRCLAEVPLDSDIPRFGSTRPLSLTLPNGVRDAEVSLEAHGRFPFGERIRLDCTTMSRF